MRLRHNGAEISVSFSFLMFNALVFMMKDTKQILSFYAVCALHEAGHLAAAAAFGTKLRAVGLSGTGIRLVTEKKPLRPVSHGAVILAAGPAVNIILYIVLKIMRCSGAFTLLNLGAAVYNLLPYSQLDGGALIHLFTDCTQYETLTDRLLNCLYFGISLSLLILTCIYGKIFLPLFAVSVLLFITELKSFHRA